MSDTTNRVSDQLESLAQESKNVVTDHALSAALIAFGVGVGTGLAVIGLLGESAPRHTSMTHRLGQSMLDAMNGIMPDSLARR